MTDPSAANLFRILGTLEPGQCTLVADEAEKIDQSLEIMSTLKTGYQFKSKVARVNMNTGKQEFYYPYGFKIIIAERTPDETKAKGVLDRTFVFNTYHGKPKYDVKEILKPAGDIKRQSLLNELIDFRKLLLIYRVIHFQDPIVDIDIGLEGRHKELCKPVLQLFHNSIHSLKEIEGSFQTLLNAKNQRKGNSIEAALHPIIVNLVSVKGRDVYVGQIWDGILETIPGIRDEKRPNEFQTYDYGTIYRNTITNIICDKFGAERRRRKEGSILSFDPEKLASIGRLYNLETRIQTKITDGVSDVGNVGSRKEIQTLLCQPSKEGVDNVGDVSKEGSENCETLLCQGVSDVSDVGFSGDTSRLSADYRNEKSEAITNASGIGAQKIHDNNTNTNNLDSFWSNNHPQSSLEPTQPTSPTPADNVILGAALAATPKAVTTKHIYRIHPHSDTFACENCRLRDDRWFMEKHDCRGSRK